MSRNKAPSNNDLSCTVFPNNDLNGEGIKDALRRVLNDRCCICHNHPMRYVAMQPPMKDGDALEIMPICEYCAAKGKEKIIQTLAAVNSGYTEKR